ncbi:helix-turn-helix transcriptional regulator [uncultured Eubacterium sp.]|uniref:helix-turn-helix domain-containing protein n=1 Tax=uncultured Eubacterium sp. TaxID=165185 RepID=UPI0025CC0329|nr:helix-turn-helix transcriptional regulator [uncultured Eubacterium sp.]
MAFNDRLKESRTSANLTQEQLAEKLGIAKSTLSGYESGNREPTIATIAKILDILNVDANYLYQDEIKRIDKIVVNIEEKTLLEKYRALDHHGKEMVDFTLEKEWERSTESTDNVISISVQPELNAAHQRTDINIPEGTDTSDNDIMDDENF